MNHKGVLKNMQMEINAPRKEWEILRQEQVGKQINAGVLFLINEVELSIYRFLTSAAKMSKNNVDQSSWGSTSLLAFGALNA